MEVAGVSTLHCTGVMRGEEDGRVRGGEMKSKTGFTTRRRRVERAMAGRAACSVLRASCADLDLALWLSQAGHASCCPPAAPSQARRPARSGGRITHTRHLTHHP